MRIVFMGSGELARPSLCALADGGSDEIVAVVTQPDRPKGRNRAVAACPVNILARSLGLPVRTPERIGDPAEVAELTALSPDLVVVAAYGQYIPRAVLDIPAQGAINVHPSLLPKYRGAAPIQWAIARGEAETGVTILFVDEKMDAGDIILQEPVPIGPEDTAVTLAATLAERGAGLLVRAVELIRQGEVRAVPQDDGRVSMAPKLSKADALIDWSRGAGEISCRVRGFQPWPVCFCEVPKGSGRHLRVYATRVESGRGAPGEVLDAAGGGPLVGTGEGALRLLEVQAQGGKRMDGRAYLNGHHVQPGDTWG